MLEVRIENVGKLYAQYVNAWIYFPDGTLDDNTMEAKIVDDTQYDVMSIDHFFKKVVKHSPTSRVYLEESPRYPPVLPGLSQFIDRFSIIRPATSEDPILYGKVKWIIHADNSPPRTGEMIWNEIYRSREPIVTSSRI